MHALHSDDELPRNWREDVVLGALVGGIAGLILVGLGLAVFGAAATVAALTGVDARAPSWGDFRVLGVYVAGFTIGGGLLGLAAPLLRWFAAKVLAGAVVGAMIMAAIAVTDAGGPAALDRASAIGALVIGAVLGAVGGVAFATGGRTKEELAEVDRRVAELDSYAASTRRIREAQRRRREARSSRERPDRPDAST